MVKYNYKNKTNLKFKNYKRKNKNESNDETKRYNIENSNDFVLIDQKTVTTRLNDEKNSNYSNDILKNESNEHINRKTNKNNIETQKKIDRESYLNFIRKFKHKIRDINIKRILSFLLGEYTETNLINNLFEILSLKKIKIIYHSLLALYNFYCNKNKAIASAVLMCISLIQDETKINN